MLHKFVIIGIIVILLGCNSSTVTFLVETPPDTHQVTIAGNRSKLGDWEPSRVLLHKSGENKFQITLKFPQNSEIEYKFTQGSWNNQALDELGDIPNNYKFIVKKDTTIRHTIKEWRNDNLVSNVIGKVEYHRSFYSPELDNYRDIIVWLPPRYEINITKHYPILYLHDGQNVFDPNTSFIGMDWQLDETVTELIFKGKMKEIIMVGIYNTKDRVSEYSPIYNGQKYSNFIINTLKPFIDSNYRTLKDANDTAVMGSSMGGIISFHLAWEYPQIFSMAGCLSPAFLVNNNEIVKRVKSTQETKQIKLVILNGSVGLESELQPAISDMVSVLEEKNYRDLKYKIFEGAEHNEAAWAEQVTLPLLYFFGK